MKNIDPILLFRHESTEQGASDSLTFDITSGMHRIIQGEDQATLPLFTNSMQTKSREAIDTVENSEI